MNPTYEYIAYIPNSDIFTKYLKSLINTSPIIGKNRNTVIQVSENLSKVTSLDYAQQKLSSEGFPSIN